MNSIYLDHAATTPLSDEALAAMEPFLRGNFANASSVYRPAQEARAALDEARAQIAECLGAKTTEIVFTSGGTEGDNAAIKGAAFASRERGRHIVTTAIEHHAVLHAAEDLDDHFGFELTVVGVGPNGIVDPRAIERAIRPDTTVVSVMWVNNEIGTIQPVEEIASIARERGIAFHTDAVQAVGSQEIDLIRVRADLLSLSAHKFYGPKGVGVLVVRDGTPWWPLLVGGGQERNRRAGTENVAGIVGMAAALVGACRNRAASNRRITSLQEDLLRGIRSRVPGVHLNGDPYKRLPGNLNLSFEDVSGESLLLALDRAGVCASSGSACASGSLDVSHVLRAIGLPERLARASLRLTIGRGNTEDEMSRVVGALEAIVERVRRLAPVGRA